MENKSPKYINPIKSIRIQNFRSLKDVKIDLSHLTFLFGPNSSGKSSFLKALLFLQNNLFPLNSRKTIFKITENLDLGSYKDIVIDNDITKDIIFEIEINYNYYFPDIRIFDIDNNPEYLKELYSKEVYGGELEKNIHELNNSNVFNLLDKYSKSFDSDKDFGNLLEKHNYHYKFIVTFSNNYRKSLFNIVWGKDNQIKSKYSKQTDNSQKNYHLKSINFVDLNSNSTLELDTNELHTSSSTGFDTFNAKINLFNDKVLNELFTKYSPYKNNFVNDYIIPNFIPSLKTLLNFSKNYEAFPDIFTEEESINKWKSFDKQTKITKYYDIIKFHYLTYFVIPNDLNIWLSSFHLPIVRELPKSRFMLNEGEFDSKDYYGFLETLYLSYESFTKHKKKYSSEHDIFKINTDLKHLGFNAVLTIEKNEDVGKLIIIYDKYRKSNLTSESSGMIQLLPILISLHINPEINMLIMEQPELHLHPKLQAILAEILVNSRKNQIIETHSEHLIRKIQVLIAKGKIHKSEIIVYYFDKVEGITQLKIMKIEDNGFFKEPWPNGFFDESYNLSKELLFPNKN